MLSVRCKTREILVKEPICCVLQNSVYIAMIYIHMVVHIILSYVWPFVCIYSICNYVLIIIIYLTCIY